MPFKVDYVSTVREAENIEDKKVSDIDREAVLAAPERLANIVGYIRDHFDQKTKRNSFYKIKDRRLAGFNSIFTVSSIEVAKKYYAEFKRQLTNAPSDKKLKIALIYSFGVNEEEIDDMIDENSEDTSGLDKSSRDFLEDAIKDYNAMFGTSFDTSSDKFQNYYKDVSERVKNREVDVLLVVNMFLTGFDATTLDVHSVVDDDWQKFVDKKKVEKLEQIIANENLDHAATYTFVRNAFRDGSVATTGTAITKVLPDYDKINIGM